MFKLLADPSNWKLLWYILIGISLLSLVVKSWVIILILGCVFMSQLYIIATFGGKAKSLFDRTQDQ